jgi:DNA-binding PadR family transcriptional regulator
MKIDISQFEGEMNRGFLQVLVLVLLENPMYGYLMVKHLEDLGYIIEENTLYPLLRRLEKNGWIKSNWDVSGGRPKKFYVITEDGRTLRQELLRIHRIQSELLSHLLEENKNV